MSVGSVAVLMCVHAGDNAALFDRAISSLRDQKCDLPIGIYLGVDGPVTPLIETVIYKHAAQFVVVSKSDRNVGLAASLNRLIGLLGSEEYIFRMDSDDSSLPHRVTRTIEYMEENGLDVCGSWIVELGSTEQSRRIVRYPPTHENVVKSLSYGSPFAHPTVCFRKQVLVQCPAYPERKSNEDIAFWFELVRNGFRLGNVPEVLLEYTVDDSFYSRRSRSKSVEELKVYLNGLYGLRGLGPHLLPPFVRFGVRQLPEWAIKVAYSMRRLIGR